MGLNGQQGLESKVHLSEGAVGLHRAMLAAVVDHRGDPYRGGQGLTGGDQGEFALHEGVDRALDARKHALEGPGVNPNRRDRPKRR